MRGTQETQPEVLMAQARRVSVEAHDGPLPAHTDGEIISTEGRRLDIEMLPAQLGLIVD
jgi:diacylglycerol kinase family enzyme